ncbi:MAG: hypothetical protein SPI52_04015, partial [Bacilli bacterium]|nr:hypothetical protein [Bacilli bacterium]
GGKVSSTSTTSTSETTSKATTSVTTSSAKPSSSSSSTKPSSSSASSAMPSSSPTSSNEVSSVTSNESTSSEDNSSIVTSSNVDITSSEATSNEVSSVVSSNEVTSSEISSNDTVSSSSEDNSSVGQIGTTIYFIDSSWWNKDAASTYIYVLNSTIENKYQVAYPGEKMTHLKWNEETKTNTWSYVIDLDTYDYCVLSRRSGDGENDWGAQTIDIHLTDEFNTIILSVEEKWNGDGNKATVSFDTLVVNL